MSKNQFICDCDIIHHEAVAAVLAILPSDNHISIVAQLFKLLGDPTRAKICLALGQQELCVCDLANVLSMSKSSVSHQLRALRAQHIVKSRRAGKEIYYALDDAHVRQILAMSLDHIKHNQGLIYA